METVQAFIDFNKCSKITPDPKYYICDGSGRDYYITHDLYDTGKFTLNRPNTYDFVKFLPKNVQIEQPEKPLPRPGRTKFRRYFGNGGGNDMFIIKNNGGHFMNRVPVAIQMREFKNSFRVPEDKTDEIMEKKRKDEMMKNKHAIEKMKELKKNNFLQQGNFTSRLSIGKESFKTKKIDEMRKVRTQRQLLDKDY